MVALKNEVLLAGLFRFGEGVTIDSSTSGIETREIDIREDLREDWRKNERSREGIGVGTFSLLLVLSEGGVLEADWK